MAVAGLSEAEFRLAGDGEQGRCLERGRRAVLHHRHLASVHLVRECDDQTTHANVLGCDQGCVVIRANAAGEFDLGLAKVSAGVEEIEVYHRASNLELARRHDGLVEVATQLPGKTLIEHLVALEPDRGVRIEADLNPAAVSIRDVRRGLHDLGAVLHRVVEQFLEGRHFRAGHSIDDRVGPERRKFGKERIDQLEALGAELRCVRRQHGARRVEAGKPGRNIQRLHGWRIGLRLNSGNFRQHLLEFGALAGPQPRHLRHLARIDLTARDRLRGSLLTNLEIDGRFGPLKSRRRRAAGNGRSQAEPPGRFFQEASGSVLLRRHSRSLASAALKVRLYR